MSDKITTLHLKNEPTTNIYPNVKIENIPLDVTISSDGENLAKTKTIYEFTTSKFLPLNGGIMQGNIRTGGFGLPEKTILGDGLDIINDSSQAKETTHYGAGYITQEDDENSSINYEYNFPKKSGTFALEEELEELKSLVYSLHSLAYNAYEFANLTTSAIPDEVDGRKVVSGSHAIIGWIGGNSVVTDDEIKSTIVSKIESWGYAPYVGKLGEINIPNAPLKLDGVNDIHNTLTFEEQEDGTYNAILTKKIGIVDLGTLNWSYDGDNTRFYSEVMPEITICQYGSSYQAPNMICQRYETKNTYYFDVSGSNMLISTNNSSSAKRIFVKDTSYTDATTFKTAMSGVMLYYELATPTSEVIATGLKFDKVSFPMEKGGTIKAVYEEVPPTISVNFMTKGE